MKKKILFGIALVILIVVAIYIINVALFPKHEHTEVIKEAI